MIYGIDQSGGSQVRTRFYENGNLALRPGPRSLELRNMKS